MTLIVLIHAVVFLIFWLTNLWYQESLNAFLVGMTGLRVNFLLVFMVFAGAVALWSAVRLVLGGQGRDGRTRRSGQTGRTHRSAPTGPPQSGGPCGHIGPPLLGGFFLLFFYGSFMVLFLKNPLQLRRLGQLWAYFRLIIDGCLLLSVAWGLRRWVRGNTALQKGMATAGLLVLWLLPVFWAPANVYRGALPEKPRLFAHRGASTLAPENTLAAMEKAVALGVWGLETDITVSADGVLFLMHDQTLARTTDVAEVFPGREDDRAESFTWEELARLDAGSWFGRRGSFAHEPIPTLEALLQVVKENDLQFIYDLRIPPAGHPFSEQALGLCLEALRDSGVAGRTWVLAGVEEFAAIQAVLPEAILATGIDASETPPAPAEVVAEGFQVVNSTYGLSRREIQAYQDAGLWVNLYVADEPWQYSRLWLVGADSVTSNNVQRLLAMERPVLAMPYGVYLAVWGVLGIIAVLVFWVRARRTTADGGPPTGR